VTSWKSHINAAQSGLAWILAAFGFAPIDAFYLHVISGVALAGCVFGFVAVIWLWRIENKQTDS